jgi:hypothetical protein
MNAKGDIAVASEKYFPTEFPSDLFVKSGLVKHTEV